MRNTLVYVLMNRAKHVAKDHGPSPRAAIVGIDPCSPAPYFNGFARAADDEARWQAATREPPPVHAAQTWLLTTGWRRHGLLPRPPFR